MQGVTVSGVATYFPAASERSVLCRLLRVTRSRFRALTCTTRYKALDLY
jgi:hypothetical protein